VWICDDRLGHLQATGIDDAGRKHSNPVPRRRARNPGPEQSLRRSLGISDRVWRAGRGLPMRQPGKPAGRPANCRQFELEATMAKDHGSSVKDDNCVRGVAMLQRIWNE
jgi:hypothetical protein